MSKKNYDSILRMARGAIEERVDYEMDRVMTNILDPNTKAAQKRKITLAPTNPVTTSLYVTGDKNGELTVVEAIPQIPGQLQMDGEEQEPPKLLKLAGMVN